ncbi:hypothetical protein BSR29_04400 [Boudabousia liubingyangii]|uniref:Methylated-DNA--protein-cysteine methyltransferase n=1 Tax=Boudabousia liubingyangii TaxID=1921764 RepID=A0A1Q5PNE7_9ACTO|nr:methylated-DNA--[protein]-cysteine S-methyltransferase [Boudabousia liubingyangii]OKL49078.1 hypothetical protein BSR29_04400 [Boudabousia liubingyangii]
MFTRHTVISTRIGELTVVANSEAITGVYFPGHEPVGQIGALVGPTSPLFMDFSEQVSDFLAGRREDFTIPFELPKSSEFNEAVWQRLTKIPYGKTTTYGNLAAELGGRNQARAVGRAVGANPLALIIPCHRVLGSDGKLTGYAGGIEAKAYLLQLEAANAENTDQLF